MKPAKSQAILQQTKDIYNRIAGDFSNTRYQNWGGFDDLAEYVEPGGRVLDLGCGNGRLAEIFTESKISYLGIDNSEELIRIAQEKFKDKPWAGFEVGDALTYPSPPNQGGGRGGSGIKAEEFDLVLMVAVLHHLPTVALRLQALENARAALKPGGRLIISNWNLWQVKPSPTPPFVRGGKEFSPSIKRASRGSLKIFRYWPYLWNYAEKISRGAYGFSEAFVPWKNLSGDNLRYVHSFRRGELKGLLKRAGFAVESIGYISQAGGRATILSGDNLLAIAVKKC